MFIQICHFLHAHTGTLRADVPWENWHSSRFLSHYFFYEPQLMPPSKNVKGLLISSIERAIEAQKLKPERPFNRTYGKGWFPQIRKKNKQIHQIVNVLLTIISKYGCWVSTEKNFKNPSFVSFKLLKSLYNSFLFQNLTPKK